MNIAFLYAWGGGIPPDQNNLKMHSISMEFLRRGHRVIWIRPFEKYRRKKSEEGIEIEEFRTSRFSIFEMLIFFKRILSILIRRKVQASYIDCWHFFRDRIHWILLFQIMLKIIRVRIVYDSRDPFPDYEIASGKLKKDTLKVKLLTLLSRIVYQLSDIIFVVSEEYRRSIMSIEGIKHRKIYGIYHGVDLEKFNLRINGTIIKQDLGLHDKFVVGWFGMMTKVRCIQELLIPLIREIPKKIPEVMFLIGGKGALKEEFINLSQGTKTPIVFLGFIPYPKIPVHMATCNVTLCIVDSKTRFGMLSLWRKVTESLALGVPVILTSTPATKHFFHRFKSIIFVENRLEDIIDSINELMKNYEKYKKRAVKDAKNLSDFSLKGTAVRIVDTIIRS